MGVVMNERMDIPLEGLRRGCELQDRLLGSALGSSCFGTRVEAKPVLLNEDKQ